MLAVFVGSNRIKGGIFRQIVFIGNLQHYAIVRWRVDGQLVAGRIRGGKLLCAGFRYRLQQDFRKKGRTG